MNQYSEIQAYIKTEAPRLKKEPLSIKLKLNISDCKYISMQRWYSIHKADTFLSNNAKAEILSIHRRNIERKESKLKKKLELISYVADWQRDSRGKVKMRAVGSGTNKKLIPLRKINIIEATDLLLELLGFVREVIKSAGQSIKEFFVNMSFDFKSEVKPFDTTCFDCGEPHYIKGNCLNPLCSLYNFTERTKKEALANADKWKHVQARVF